MANALNAKNLPFTEPGAGLELGGVTPRNLYAKYDKLRGVRDEKAGGSRQLWENLSRYTTTKNAANLNPEQATLFNEYIKTGVKPAGLNDQTAATAMDWGLREAGRFQQHKPVSLLEKIAGPLLTIAASAIPVVGPYAGAAVGGYMGSRHGGGLLGAGLGALGGYMGGNAIAKAGGVSGIYNSAKDGLSSVFGSGGGFSNPAALGLSGENLGLNFASAPGGFGAVAPAGYGASALGLQGANLALPGLANALPAIPVRGYGASAIGGDPSTLYNPASAGPPKPSALDSALNALGNFPGLPAMGGAPDTPAAGPSLSGPGNVTPSLLPPPASPGSFQAPEFEAALSGGGMPPSNSLAMTGMGAGLMPDRGMGRVPGYQLRTFGNYLMRP